MMKKKDAAYEALRAHFDSAPFPCDSLTSRSRSGIIQAIEQAANMEAPNATAAPAVSTWVEEAWSLFEKWDAAAEAVEMITKFDAAKATLEKLRAAAHAHTPVDVNDIETLIGYLDDSRKVIAGSIDLLAARRLAFRSKQIEGARKLLQQLL